MPGPLALVLGAVGVGVGGLAMGQVSRVINTATQPLEELLQQEVWNKLPYQLPSVEAIMQAGMRGHIKDWNAAYDAMQRQGVDFKADTYYGKIWQGVRELAYPRPGIPDIMVARARDILTFGRAEELLEKLAARPDDWDWYARMVEEHLTPDQAIAAWLRGFITEQDLDKILRFHRFPQASEMKIMKKMALELPPPSEVLRMVVKEAFNDQKAKELDLDAEYDQQGDFKDIAYGVGIGEAEYTTRGGEKKKIDVAKLFWRAHWDLPSPTQAYEMLKRLRPDRIKAVREQFKDVKELRLEPVTLQDVRNLLSASDYAPLWRDRLAAISYNVLTRTDARRMFETKVIKRDELKATYQDQGYSERDAENLTKFSETEIKLKELNKTKRISKAAVLESYKLGAIDRDLAASRLYELTLTTVKDWEDWLAVPAAARGNFALSKGVVRGDLETVELQLKIDHFRQQLSAVKYQFLNGLLSLNGLAVALDKLGVIPERRSHYIGVWAALRDGPRKTLTLRELLTIHSEGVIGDFDLRDRLLNLGYPRRDAQEVTTMAGIKFRRRVETAMAREMKERQREQEKLRKELERLAKPKGKPRTAPPGGPSVDKAQKWYKMGLINEAELVKRLKELGWEQRYIDDAIEEATPTA